MLFSQLRAYLSHSAMLCASGISSPPTVPEITFSKVLRDHAKQESVCALSQLTAGKGGFKTHMRNPEMVGSLPRSWWPSLASRGSSKEDCVSAASDTHKRDAPGFMEPSIKTEPRTVNANQVYT